MVIFAYLKDIVSSSLILSYSRKTAVKNLSPKNSIISIITWRKGKYCIYCYFIAMYLQTLGTKEAHSSRGKIKISRCSLIKDDIIKYRKKINFRNIQVYNIYLHVGYFHFLAKMWGWLKPLSH